MKIKHSFRGNPLELDFASILGPEIYCTDSPTIVCTICGEDSKACL